MPSFTDGDVEARSKLSWRSLKERLEVGGVSIRLWLGQCWARGVPSKWTCAMKRV